ncbi:GNAT family N-acetyltransferase [Pseudomonas aeruginosa]|nr:GNAT family N-acetyltransferase [Pseudomonas aeruginosa]MBF3042058.1 GNAT family N-acetyltransferase [Pseudomonas aeruginosa]MBF3207737.1 GNAT family N-acetyltransferase [Pseudomonas aeruginosa]
MQPIHDSQGVFAVLEKEVRRLGFDYYAYGVRHTIPFTRPKTEVHGTYPKAWLGRYRHQVFIEKLGWDVVSTSRVRDQEFDQFDHPQTRYIVAMGRQGICGCARLLPTTDAYLLKEVFAYLCSETPPSDPSVWELSRYAASAADDPQLAMKIFWSSLQCAWYLGASSVVAVTTTAMERYFVRNGVILQRLGPPQKVKGETLVAISFPAYQERGLEMLLRYHPEWLQGVPLSMAV